MNEEIRHLLIERARIDAPIAYSDVMRSLGLDHENPDDRKKLSYILYEISKYENENRRPLLSSMAMYANFEDHGPGFYELSEEFGFGSKKELQNRMFAFDQMASCKNFWQNDDNYNKYRITLAPVTEAPVKTTTNILRKHSLPADGLVKLPEIKPSFKGVNRDFIQEAIDKKEIGDAGEALVKQYEENWLKSLGLDDIAEKVQKVEDGKGYDILSFDQNGNPKYVEVKTTTGDALTPFDYSLNEYLFAKRKGESYLIYRLYGYDAESNSADFFIIEKPMSQLLFQPTGFMTYLKRKI